jgi:hypothetical protein
MQELLNIGTIFSKENSTNFYLKKIPGKLGQVLGIAGKPLMSSIS